MFLIYLKLINKTIIQIKINLFKKFAKMIDFKA